MTSSLAADLRASLDPVEGFERAIGTADPWQAEVLRGEHDQVLICCGRQTGKSTVVGGLATEQIKRPGRTVVLLSPSLRQSGELYNKVRHHHAKTGGPRITAESATRIETENGSRVLSLPSSEATVRGFSAVDLVVIDEAARVPDALYAAVRPMLAVSGGTLVALSTPHGKRGFFAEAWHGDEAWKRVRVPSTDCPRISAEFLARERRSLPAWVFNQEYLALFEDNVAAVFRAEEIAAAFDQSTVAPLWTPGVAVPPSAEPDTETGALWSATDTAERWSRIER